MLKDEDEEEREEEKESKILGREDEKRGKG